MELILLRDRSLIIRVTFRRVNHGPRPSFFQHLHALYLVCFNSPIIQQTSKKGQQGIKGLESRVLMIHTRILLMIFTTFIN